MMVIDNKFDLGQHVYLVTDNSQAIRIVTGIKVSITGSLIYCLACGPSETWHYDIEINSEKDVVGTFTNTD